MTTQLQLIAINLSKKIKLNDFQRINVSGKLENQANGAKMFFIFEKSEETILEFLQNSENIL